MALSDVRGRSAVVAGAGSVIGRWVALQLARPRARDDPAKADGSRGPGEDLVTQPLESHHVTAVRPVPQPIDGPPKMVGIREVLTAWRAAERQLTEIPEGSPEWTRVHAEISSLRASYHRLFAESRDRRPDPEVRWRDVVRPEVAGGLQLFEVR